MDRASVPVGVRTAAVVGGNALGGFGARAVGPIEAPGARRSDTLDGVQINFGGREIALKLVYYGPALSGKTTNLRSLHHLTTEGSRGRLITPETKDHRTP